MIETPNETDKCLVCGIKLEDKREGTKYCSSRCRLIAHRRETLNSPQVEMKRETKADVVFGFKTVSYDLNTSHPERKPTYKNRTAKYWYDVPLGAIPILKEGWPKMPDYMNGRQYFLWWKNNFEEGDRGPIILDPLPKYENVTYKPMSSRMGV